MQKCKGSNFLQNKKNVLKEVITILSKQFDYISVLGTDSFGLSYQVTQKEKRATDSMWVERGFVFRAQKNGFISEFALDNLSSNAAEIAEHVSSSLNTLFSDLKDNCNKYPTIPDEKISSSWFGEYKDSPFEADPDTILNKLDEARQKAQSISNEIVYVMTRADFMNVSKIFISPNKNLEQSFIWSQAYYFTLARRGENSKDCYQPFSGLKGLEILDEMLVEAPKVIKTNLELLDAEKIKPGTYEVILDQSGAGMLAHEAFGHGIEADMIVKGRAKGADFIGKQVANPLVTMWDGAKGQTQCGSFFFDDEGQLGTKTKVIDKGILVSALTDIQSALALKMNATGNGRRQAYDHKAYARMTNTYFEPGKDKIEDMIKSVKFGYLLEKPYSGMEDPKNWGIQLLLSLGREIVDGKLTGKVVSPIVCSGYVPEVLNNITMISGEEDFELAGSGYCGKGYKEFVKVSDGGPWLKTKMRLG